MPSMIRVNTDGDGRSPAKYKQTKPLFSPYIPPRPQVLSQLGDLRENIEERTLSELSSETPLSNEVSLSNDLSSLTDKPDCGCLQNISFLF